jgi:hypothetical protein
MHPVITVYYHGSGGRYLSLVAQALLQPTKLIDSCSGHLNPSIPMLHFTVTGDRNQDLYILQNAWQELQNKTPSPIVHSQHADLNLLLCALKDVNFLHITAEPDDAADLAYNWYYKNLSEIQKGDPQDRPERIQKIQARQLQYKNLMLSDPFYNNINPDIFDGVEMTDCEFWATITAEFVGKHLQRLNALRKPTDPDHRIFEISWKDLKAGLLKNRLPELASAMGIELYPDREQNAREIIEQWTSNQPRVSVLDFSLLQKAS